MYIISATFVTELVKEGLIHEFNFVTLKRGTTSFISELSGQYFQSYKYNDRTVLLPNFKAVGQTQAELHSLKVEKLDAHKRPLFANLVTFTVGSSLVLLSALLWLLWLHVH